MGLDDKAIENIARICHEANRTYCKTIGDTSQVAWEVAPEWQKSSAINGVKYHLSHPHSEPEDSHNSWKKQKEEEGWTYGEVKDPDAKKHPCMVEFGQLPVEQQKKDHLFLGIVRALGW